MIAKAISEDKALNFMRHMERQNVTLEQARPLLSAISIGISSKRISDPYIVEEIVSSGKEVLIGAFISGKNTEQAAEILPIFVAAAGHDAFLRMSAKNLSDVFSMYRIGDIDPAKITLLDKTVDATIAMGKRCKEGVEYREFDTLIDNLEQEASNVLIYAASRPHNRNYAVKSTLNTMVKLLSNINREDTRCYAAIILDSLPAVLDKEGVEIFKSVAQVLKSSMTDRRLVGEDEFLRFRFGKAAEKVGYRNRDCPAKYFDQGAVPALKRDLVRACQNSMRKRKSVHSNKPIR